MRERLSQRAYARHRGVSHEAVRKAVNAGRIPMHEGRIDPAEADAAWERNSDPAKRRATSESLRTNAAYAHARAERERCRAEIARLDLARRRGLLMERAEVERLAFTRGRRVRDQLLALPAQLAAVIAGTEDPATVERVLEDAIDRALETLAE